jgi:hypothetical protein
MSIFSVSVRFFNRTSFATAAMKADCRISPLAAPGTSSNRSESTGPIYADKLAKQ